MDARRRVLLLGAGGFLGRHVLRALTESGHEVTSVRRSTAPPQTARHGREVVLDLAGDRALDILPEVEFSVAVHCAAVLPSMRGALDEPAAAEANRRLDALAIELCRRGHARLIYPSGTNVYGMAPGPWRESGPIDPVGPYAMAKVESERAILDGLSDCAILRISAPYGVGQRARTVMRIFLDRALASEDLTYHGSGSREQDFVAVEDVAAAIASAVSLDASAGVVNVASGRPISMLALARIVRNSVPGCASRIMASGQPDPQESYRPRVDLSRARDVLRWEPRIPLEEGVLHWARDLAAGRG